MEAIEDADSDDDISLDMMSLKDAPGFGNTLLLSHPSIDTSLPDGFELEIAFNYVFSKATELQKK